jgi:hypothetical protein
VQAPQIRRIKRAMLTATCRSESHSALRSLQKLHCNSLPRNAVARDSIDQSSHDVSCARVDVTASLAIRNAPSRPPVHHPPVPCAKTRINAAVSGVTLCHFEYFADLRPRRRYQCQNLESTAVFRGCSKCRAMCSEGNEAGVAETELQFPLNPAVSIFGPFPMTTVDLGSSAHRTLRRANAANRHEPFKAIVRPSNLWSRLTIAGSDLRFRCGNSAV